MRGPLANGVAADTGDLAGFPACDCGAEEPGDGCLLKYKAAPPARITATTMMPIGLANDFFCFRDGRFTFFDMRDILPLEPRRRGESLTGSM
jgi:hypothetical protein